MYSSSFIVLFVAIEGLCRTCEIFGASALVLDNLRHVNDKHFQSLSVSSELWLPLLEVKYKERSQIFTPVIRMSWRSGVSCSQGASNLRDV